MERLNYFNPYQSKPGYHEDQLSRAFLALLKHSFHAFATFYDYCHANHILEGEEKHFGLHELLEDGWLIETQKGNPTIETNKVLSILITDDEISRGNSSVEVSDRNARYDGIITFGKNLTLVIENKPRSGNIWFDQLNPTRENLSEDTLVYSRPVMLEWKLIIKFLNHLLSVPSINGSEKIMIEDFIDFIDFIDDNFPYLNPYDRFDYCKGNPELLQRRIKSALDKAFQSYGVSARYHKNWGYCVPTPFASISQIGLILNWKNKNEWILELSFYPGDTINQARNLYRQAIQLDKLESNRWYAQENFHVSFMTSNLIHFSPYDEDGKQNVKRYIQYWQNNLSSIRQLRREEVKSFLQDLQENKIIPLTKEEEVKLEDRFWKTKMSTLNICPGLGLIHDITSDKAEEWDKKGVFEKKLTEKVIEGLSILGLEWKKKEVAILDTLNV